MAGKENKDMRLDAILEYEMDEIEAKAYRIYIFWLDISRKVFPDYNHGGVKSGDPRKSMVFKYCYKLVRESEGIIDEKDYSLYVRAQLDILRHINIGKHKPLISPNCLVGEKAWKRWKLWKRKYEAATKKPTENSQVNLPGVAKALDGLQKTKDFIQKNLGENPTYEDYEKAFIDGKLSQWINFGKISPYYMCVSPFIIRIFKDEGFRKLNFDTKLYEPLITETVKMKFKELFGYEK